MIDPHWHTEDNPCLLFDVPVEPKWWCGGIIAVDGRWRVVDDVNVNGGVVSPERCSPEMLAEDASGKLLKSYFGRRDDRAWWSFRYEGTKGEFRQARQTKPIFPPAGFAGRTDAELWDELVDSAGHDGYPLLWLMYATDSEGLKVGIDAGGCLSLSICNGYQPAPHESTWTLRDPTALNLALQNAQVLARRLADLGLKKGAK